MRGKGENAVKQIYIAPAAEPILFAPAEKIAFSDLKTTWRTVGSGIDTPLESADPID